VAEEQTERWVAVEGSSNVRDLGGLPLRGGGTTASGVFYRSDTPQEWTLSDTQAWRERGLGLVVDLRTPLEAEQEGRGPLVDAGEVRYLNAPLLPDEAVLRDDSELVVHDDSRRARVERYLSYLSGDGGRNLVRAVEALTDSEAPALFHCAAGKDRTGVLAAFLLEVAGVEREAVVADYALTTERLDGIVERLSRA
jgi:protein-tyrosine phosphatase